MSSKSRRPKNAGKIVILSSPSGGGKTSLTRKLLKKHKRDGWTFSISVTTRPMRPNEKDGREYHFRSRKEFAKIRRRGNFAESCVVHGHLYGTPREPIEKIYQKGGVILLDVDVKGAFKIKKAFPQAVSIFIVPPSTKELRRRLKARGTETAEQLKIRLNRSLAEMELFRRFDYTVINDDLDEATKLVDCIIHSFQARKKSLDFEYIESIIR